MRRTISYPPLVCFLKEKEGVWRVKHRLRHTRSVCSICSNLAVASFCPLQGSCDVCPTKFFFYGAPHFAHCFGHVEQARQTFWTVSSIWNRALALLVLHLVLKSMMPASDHALRSERGHTHIHTRCVCIIPPQDSSLVFLICSAAATSTPPFDSELCHPWILR